MFSHVVFELAYDFYLPGSRSKSSLYIESELISAQGGSVPHVLLHRKSSDSNSSSRNKVFSCGNGHELTICAMGTCRLSGLPLGNSKGSMTSDPFEAGLRSSERGERGRSLWGDRDRDGKEASALIAWLVDAEEGVLLA